MSTQPEGIWQAFFWCWCFHLTVRSPNAQVETRDAVLSVGAEYHVSHIVELHSDRYSCGGLPWGRWYACEHYYSVFECRPMFRFGRSDLGRGLGLVVSKFIILELHDFPSNSSEEVNKQKRTKNYLTRREKRGSWDWQVWMWEQCKAKWGGNSWEKVCGCVLCAVVQMESFHLRK